MGTEKIYHISRLLLFITNHYNHGNEKLIYELSELRKFQLKNISYEEKGLSFLLLHVFIGIIDVFHKTEDTDYIEGFVKKY